MKKSLFALALTGALAFTAAQAVTANEDMDAAQYTKGTTFYGSMRLGVDYGKNHRLNDKAGLDVRDYGSRLGFKGGEDLGNGTWAIYKAEFGFDAAGDSKETFKARNAFIGFYGADWGALTIGRQNNPFNTSMFVGTALDDYYMTAGDYASAAAWAASMNVGINVTSRVGNSIAYTSPVWGGFDFQVAVIADAEKYIVDENGDVVIDPVTGHYNSINRSRGADAVVAGFNYKHESGFVANATYITTEVTDRYAEGSSRPYAYGVKLGYESDALRIAGIYTGGQNKISTGNKFKVNGWDIVADYSFGADLGSTIRANFGQGKVKDGVKATAWAIGFEQDLSSRTRAFVEYSNFETKFEKAKSKVDKVALGIRHDF